MKKPESFTQCRMQRLVPSFLHENFLVTHWYTAWIPSEIAVEGYLVKLKFDDGHWEENWEIVEVYKKFPIHHEVKRYL